MLTGVDGAAEDCGGVLAAFAARQRSDPRAVAVWFRDLCPCVRCTRHGRQCDLVHLLPGLFGVQQYWNEVRVEEMDAGRGRSELRRLLGVQSGRCVDGPLPEGIPFDCRDVLLDPRWQHGVPSLVRPPLPAGNAKADCLVDLVAASASSCRSFFLEQLMSSLTTSSRSWIISKIVPSQSRTRETLQFLLDHPRRCFIYLFPSQCVLSLTLCELR